MKIVGIIAEYNPFHNGHLYQMRQAKEQTGADFVVAAMSGDFVQRGAPAVYAKYVRAQMALEAGADLVLELPAAFATGSAEEFAACGVALLDRLGCVQELCFGSECGDLKALTAAASHPLEETEDFQAALRGYLKQGFTYPKARDAAWREAGDDAGGTTSVCEAGADAQAKGGDGWQSAQAGSPDGCPAAQPSGGLPSSPNDILGAAYISALKARGSAIRPVAVRRIGNSYHDGDLAGSLSSATAIRNRILEYSSRGIPVEADEEVRRAVPACAWQLLRHAVPVSYDDFSLLLNERLLYDQQMGIPYERFLDVPADLDARIRKQLLDFDDFESRIQKLKTRQYTYARISRALTHILLGITKEQALDYKRTDYVRYARILGLRRSADGLMKKIKNEGEIPLVSKVADAPKQLSAPAWDMLKQDLYCSHLYQTAVWNRCRQKQANEYTRSVIRI